MPDSGMLAVFPARRQGAIYMQRGLSADAETEYRSALRLNPQFVPAAINLAELLRYLGRDVEAGQVLQTALQASPRDAGLHYALGLAMVREKRLDDAIEELRRASELEPDRAVALNSAGRPQKAIAALKDNLARHPYHRETLVALVSFNREIGDMKSALGYAERLAQFAPTDPGLMELIDALKQKIGAGGQ